jgi:hypothetical protein
MERACAIQIRAYTEAEAAHPGDKAFPFSIGAITFFFKCHLWPGSTNGSGT